MNIQVTCRHSKITSGTQEFLKGELESLTKFYDNITSAHAILDSECTLTKTVEIVVQAAGHTLSATSRAENYGKAAVESLEKVARMLKKQNEKIKSHKTDVSKSKEAVSA